MMLFCRNLVVIKGEVIYIGINNEVIFGYEVVIVFEVFVFVFV